MLHLPENPGTAPDETWRPSRVPDPRERERLERDANGVTDADPASNATRGAGRVAAAAAHNPSRVAAVRETGLLDAEAQPAFDRVTRLAARLLRAPAAFVSLVDERRDFYLSAVGLPEPLASARELTGETFCHYTVDQATPDAPLVIPDTAAHPVYSQVPTVRTLGVAAYVGVPLVVRGQPIGALCVIDTAPRAWSSDEVEVLGELAASARRELELQAALKEAQRAEAARRESEDRFRLMADVVPQIVWITDAEGRTEFFNRQWTVYTGRAYEPTSAVQIAATAIHPDDAAPTIARFDEARRTGAMYHIEHRIRSASGEYRWFLVRAEPYRDPATGAIVRWFGASVDIHDRKVAEEALRTSEERYALAARATNNAIWDWDLATGSLSWNEGVHEVLGYSLRSVGDGISWWSDALHPEDRERVLDGLHAVVAGAGGGRAWRDEYRFRRGDGGYATVVDRGYVARDASGRATRMIGAIADVTIERAAAAERERLLDAERAAREAADAARWEAEAAREVAEASRREAERANRARTDFLAVMSHELRTPLNAIGGYAQLIELGVRGPVTPEQHADLERIQRSQRHLLGLVNEVLNYAKLEAGSVAFDIADVDVRAAISEAEALVRLQADTKGLTLTVGDCPPGLCVRADAEKLRQVLVNLLSNVVKFTDRGGASIDMEYTAAHSDPVVQIHVRDTGIGIPADKLEAIFEPFVQVRAGLTRTAEGTGLGLAISRDLARGMGGDLVAESVEGAGSTLTLTLPRAK